jgi:hypothetical protein
MGPREVLDWFEAEGEAASVTIGAPHARAVKGVFEPP